MQYINKKALSITLRAFLFLFENNICIYQLNNYLCSVGDKQPFCEMNKKQLQDDLPRVIEILKDVMLNIMGKTVFVIAYSDELRSGAIYMQCTYYDHCRESGKLMPWKGRKWYLSPYMTDDEIVKTAFAAFKATVEHEIMEGFTYKEVVVFNPHVSYRALMSVSDQQVRRDSHE